MSETSVSLNRSLGLRRRKIDTLGFVQSSGETQSPRNRGLTVLGHCFLDIFYFRIYFLIYQARAIEGGH